MARTPTIAEFEALYRATAPELFGYLRRRGASDPEDLVAEIYVIAWRRRTELPALPATRAWLFGVARRLLLSEGRRQTREQQTLEARVGQAEELIDTNSHSAQGRGGDHLEKIVADALERLPPDERELLRLTEWERLSTAEIAVAFGIKPGTARVRLHRARRRLAADPQLRTLPTQRPQATGTTAHVCE